jgi:hypothetical protein
LADGVLADEPEVAGAEVLGLGRCSTDSEELEHAATAINAAVAVGKPRVRNNARPIRTVQP